MHPLQRGCTSMNTNFGRGQVARSCQNSEDRTWGSLDKINIHHRYRSGDRTSAACCTGQLHTAKGAVGSVAAVSIGTGTGQLGQRAAEEFGNRDDRATGVADAVATGGAGQERVSA